jgi:hypothetical protein
MPRDSSNLEPEISKPEKLLKMKGWGWYYHKGDEVHRETSGAQRPEADDFYWAANLVEVFLP